jgi:lysophospholipase
MMSAPFTQDRIQAQWRELYFDTWQISSPLEKAYFSFYHIDFENKRNDIIHHFGFIEADDYKLATHYFENTRSTAGTIFVLHGYFDHVGLYGHLLNFYFDKGFSVVAFDLPGHGLSTGAPASIDRFAHYTDAFDVILNTFAGKAPLPFSVCGQSTGCAIIMDYLLTRQAIDHTFKHTILLAPLVRPVAWTKVQFLYAASRMMFLHHVKRAFWKNSHDEAFLKFLERDDPLQCKTVSVAWVGALKAWIELMKTRQAVDTPLLIIQGQDDDTVDWRFNIPFIEQLFPNAIVHFIKNARHHLVNESNEIRRELFDVMSDWLNHNE